MEFSKENTGRLSPCMYPCPSLSSTKTKMTGQAHCYVFNVSVKCGRELMELFMRRSMAVLGRF